MNKEQLQLLGLPEGATDEQITAALNPMKTKADSADSLQLAAVTQTVDQAIADRKILADQRDHFIKLGKSAGVEMLADTFKAMPQQMKPTDTIQLSKETAPTPAQDRPRPRPTRSSATSRKVNACNSARSSRRNICASTKRNTATTALTELMTPDKQNQ